MFDPSNSAEKVDAEVPMLYSKYILRGRKNQTEKNDSEKNYSFPPRTNWYQIPDLDKSFKTIFTETPNDALSKYNSEIVPSKLKDETFPRILFLGTGSGNSHLYRNQSGILLHLSYGLNIQLNIQLNVKFICILRIWPFSLFVFIHFLILIYFSIQTRSFNPIGLWRINLCTNKPLLWGRSTGNFSTIERSLYITYAFGSSYWIARFASMACH